MPDPREAELRRLARVKAAPVRTTAQLGDEMLVFFKQAVQKRHTKLSHIAECWARLVPDLLSSHCSLEALNRGTLTVIVDSSAHLYELKQLLLAGLDEQLLLACKQTGLRKISLKLGRWYESSEEPGRSPRF
jgi:hypothetical protein